MIYACAMFFVDKDQFLVENSNKLIMAIGFILIGLRSLSNLRIINDFRTLIDLLLEVVQKLFTFTIILLLIMIIFAIANNLIGLNTENQETMDATIGG